MPRNMTAAQRDTRWIFLGEEKLIELGSLTLEKSCPALGYIGSRHNAMKSIEIPLDIDIDSVGMEFSIRASNNTSALLYKNPLVN